MKFDDLMKSLEDNLESISKSIERDRFFDPWTKKRRKEEDLKDKEAKAQSKIKASSPKEYFYRKNPKPEIDTIKPKKIKEPEKDTSLVSDPKMPRVKRY